MKNIAVIFLGFGIAIPAQQSIAAPTDPQTQDIAQFVEQCKKDPKCDEAWRAMKEQAKKYQDDLKALCATNKPACIAQQTKAFEELVRAQAHCTLGSANCETELNASATQAEDKLLTGSWCDANQEGCAVLKPDRAKRKEQGKTWCGANRKECKKILTDVATLEKDREARRKKIQDDVNKAYAEEELKRERDWFLSRAECDGDPNTCLTQLDKSMDWLELQRQLHFCKEGKELLCSSIKKERAKRIKQKATWCGANKAICEQAKQSLIAKLAKTSN